MELSCIFMADRHSFTKVSGDQETVTDTLIELHRRDAWHGIHGNWIGHPKIPSCQISPMDTPEDNHRKIISSVAFAFEFAQGKAANQ